MDAPRDGNHVPTVLLESSTNPGEVFPAQGDEATGRLLVSGGGGSSPLTTKGDLYGYSTMDARIPVGANGTVLSADSGEALGVKWIAVAGTGTVTTVSVVSANGFAGSVANATTTPAITLTTTITGILSGNGTAISAAATTGSGSVVLATSPTLVTPILGVATATSINKVTLTAPATGSTLTISDGKTLTASNTLTFTGTDSSSIAFGAGGTVAYTANKLSVFAATTSAELAGVISDETGTGLLVFGTAPTFASTITVGTAGGTTGAVLLKGTTSGTVTVKVADAAGTWTMTLPANDGDADQFLKTDGSGVTSWATPAGGGSPGGSDTQIQYNNGGAFGGMASATYDDTTLHTTFFNQTVTTGTTRVIIREGEADVNTSNYLLRFVNNAGTTRGGVTSSINAINIRSDDFRDVDTAYFNLTTTSFSLIDSIPIAWANGAPYNTMNIGIKPAAASIACLRVSDGSTGVGWIVKAGDSYATAQSDATTTTLANVTGLTSTVIAGRKYRFKAVLHVTADATGGGKYAIGGTATATSIIYETRIFDNTTDAYVAAARHTALASATGQAGATEVFVTIEGFIVVNAGGTLTVQFAQNAANGTSSVLVGSTFNIIDTF